MQTLSSTLLTIHVIAGFFSLALFWLPIFTRKGSINHVKMGKLYMWLMSIVVLTAGILSIKNFYIGQTEAAAFLGFLSLITANPLWKGVAILNQKKGLSKSFQQRRLAFEILVFLAGVALLSYAYYLGGEGGAVLMIIFGILGVSNIGTVITLIKNPPQEIDWFVEHGAEMMVSGIAAYTAFFAFGGRTMFGHIFTGYWMIVPWVAPSIIGTFGIIYMKKYYAQKRKGMENTPIVS